jgi:hypothetical protein
MASIELELVRRIALVAVFLLGIAFSVYRWRESGWGDRIGGFLILLGGAIAVFLDGFGPVEPVFSQGQSEWIALVIVIVGVVAIAGTSFSSS